MTKKKIITCIAVFSAVILAAVYAVCILKADCFPDGSAINGTDVGGMTASEAEEALAKTANKVIIQYDDSDKKKINTAFTYQNHRFDKMIKKAAANPFRARKLKLGDVTVDMKVSGGIKETADILNKSKISEENEKSKDAYIDFEKMEIVKEVYGNRLDYEKLANDIAVYVEQGKEENAFVFKTEDYIKPPKVFATDQALINEFKFYDKYIGQGLTLIYPNDEAVFVTPKELREIVEYKEGEAVFSEEAAAKLVDKYSSYRPSSANVSTKDGDKNLPNYVLSVPIDKEQAKTDILNALRDFQKEVHLTAEGSISLPSSRVEINLSNQTLSYIKNDKRKFSCDIVSGTSSHRTPEGIFEVAYKDRNVDLKGQNDDGSRYSSHVDYWMPFNGDIGMHDASWRGSFGGGIYLNNGSHGCINMPAGYAKKLYNSIEAGTVVVVYQ